MTKKIVTNLILLTLILVLVISLTTGVVYSNKIYQVSKEVNLLENKEIANYHVMVIVDGTDEAYSKEFYTGLEKASRENKVAVEFVEVKDTDYVRSFLEKVDIAIQSNVDGIIIHAFKNPELEAYVQKATQKGIPVITLNEDLTSTDRISFIGINKYQIGFKAGQYLMAAINGPGKIAVIEKNVIYNDNADQVIEEGKVSDDIIVMGIRDAISDRDDLTVEVIKFTNKGLLSAEGVTIKLFDEYKDISGIFCADGQDTLGVIQVLLDFNMTSEVALVGYDDDPVLLDYIERNNVIEATIVTDYEAIGRKAIEAFVEYKKEKIVSSYINTDVTVIDKTNIGQYRMDVATGDDNEKSNRLKSIKGSMLLYSISLLLITAALPMYTLNMTNRYKDQIDNMFETQVYLSGIEEMLISVDDNLIGFLSSKDSSDLNQYMIDTEALKDMVADSYVTTFNVEDLMIKDIANMITNYLIVSDESISLKRLRNVSGYVDSYTVASNIKNYIIDYISQLNSIQLDENATNYLYMVQQMETMERVTTILIVDLIIVSIVVVYLITSRMIRPITKLSHSAEEISKGRFDTEDIIVESDDEIRIMADAFNKMKNSIGSYIDELKTKAETEAKLKDQQVENLKMQNLLDNAKLYALQSQINPHFLFNTINAGVQMSMLEGADRTSEFLESMSSLFRYNIKKMDSEVVLADELNNIEHYYELLKVRFGDLIKFKFMIDSETLQTKMPPLILQPLVENAYIHGLSGKEEGGTITIIAVKNNESVMISVKDDGKGISQDRIALILQPENNDFKAQGAGIGVRNVRDRLEIFYHLDNVFSIESQVDEGTKIIIKIPNKVLEYFR